MNVSKISFKAHEGNKKAHIPPQATGYAAVGTIATSVASGFSKKKPMRTVHKASAILSVILVAAHIIGLKSLKVHHNHKTSSAQGGL